MTHSYDEILHLTSPDPDVLKKKREFFQRLADRCGPQIDGGDLELIELAVKAALADRIATGAPGLADSIRIGIARSVTMKFIKAKQAGRDAARGALKNPVLEQSQAVSEDARPNSGFDSRDGGQS